jgi:hypothetical protein
VQKKQKVLYAEINRVCKKSSTQDLSGLWRETKPKTGAAWRGSTYAECCAWVALCVRMRVLHAGVVARLAGPKRRREGAREVGRERREHMEPLATRRYLGEQAHEHIQRRWRAQAHSCTNTQGSHPAPAQVCCRAACCISARRTARTRAKGTAAS